jgi:hypothetical protein
MAACARRLRRHCRGAEVGTCALSEAAQVRECPVVVGPTSAGEVFGKFEAVTGGVPLPVRGAKQRTILALLARHRGTRQRGPLIDAL